MYRAGDTYVSVRPDYGDLASTVGQIVGNISGYMKMRISARRQWVDHVNLKSMVQHFWASVCVADEDYLLAGFGPNANLSDARAASDLASLPAAAPAAAPSNLAPHSVSKRSYC